MTLPYDVARCIGVFLEGQWREGCKDCRRRTEPGHSEWQTYTCPPPIVVFECEKRIPPERKELVLPWPPKDLSPNARLHWSTRSKAAKAYREACWVLTRQHIASGGFLLPDGILALWLDFYPPDRRARDDDNIIAAFKAGRDGMADALGINDRLFRVFPFVKDEIGGMVKVRITGVPKA